MDGMRVAIGQRNELTHEWLTYAQQLGVSGVQLNTPTLPGAQSWSAADLRWLRERCEQYGLRLEAIENVPLHFYDRAMLGLDGRDEQIANYQATIRNMGEAGIPVLGYHWMPNGVWRTPSVRRRGGVLATSFDETLIDTAPLLHGIRHHPLLGDRVIDAETMWDNYCYFMERVLPVAEASGVTLALHPDDPPMPMLGNIARLFYHFEGFARAMDRFDSQAHGLDFCMGCWSEMGPGVIEAIRYFGSRKKITYVHFRDVVGHVPCFEECFLGEGNVDVVAAVRALHEVGFTGFLLDDHVPAMIDDTVWGHRGRAYATGYIQGLLAATASVG